MLGVAKDVLHDLSQMQDRSEAQATAATPGRNQKGHETSCAASLETVKVLPRGTSLKDLFAVPAQSLISLEADARRKGA